MKYLPSDKYNVAWFKLAECIARGERERAFGLHRLLVHSFDDSAFALQLEGDILLAFDDSNNALIKYYQAVNLYKESQRYLEAAAVAEHILVLSQQKYEPLLLLVELYESLNMVPKLLIHAHALFALLLARGALEEAEHCIQKISCYVTPQQLKMHREQLLHALMKIHPEPTPQALRHMQSIIEVLLDHNDTHVLHLFLIQLQQMNAAYYEYARRLCS